MLRHKALYAQSPPIKPAVVTSPKLVDVCVDHCRNMLPLQKWFVKMEGLAEA